MSDLRRVAINYLDSSFTGYSVKRIGTDYAPEYGDVLTDMSPSDIEQYEGALANMMYWDKRLNDTYEEATRARLLAESFERAKQKEERDRKRLAELIAQYGVPDEYL
jgi:hypothetical protein